MKLTIRLLGAAVAAVMLVGTAGGAAASPLSQTERRVVATTAVQGSAQVVLPATVPWTTCPHNTATTGVPSTCFYKDVQGYMLQAWGYPGPMDGVMGSNSWKAMQRLLKQGSFYTGAIDGVAGPATKKALQKYLARAGLYSGRIDGVLGKASWKALAIHVTGWMD